MSSKNMSTYEVVPIGQVNTTEICTCISVGNRYIVATYSSGHILVHDRLLFASQTFCVADTLFSATQSGDYVAIIASSSGILRMHLRTGQFVTVCSGLHVFASTSLRIRPLLGAAGYQELCMVDDVPHGLYSVEYTIAAVDPEDKGARNTRRVRPTQSTRAVAPCGRTVVELKDDYCISAPEGVFLQQSGRHCLLRQNPRDPVDIVDFSVRDDEIAIALSNGQVAFGELDDDFGGFTDFGFKATTLWVGDELYVGGVGALVAQHGVVYYGGNVELVRGDRRDVYFAVEGGALYRIIKTE